MAGAWGVFTLGQAVNPPTTGDLVNTPQAGAAPANSTTTTTTGTQQPAATPAAGGAAGGSSPFGGGLTMPLLLVLMMAVLIVPSMLASRKEKKKRETLLSSMGKGDTVITIGGQIGIIDQIKDTEVILKIDPNSNAKARFSKASIQAVVESVNKPAAEIVAGGGGGANIEIKAKSDSAVSSR
jgi:preprotein translocase subunit YajC